MNNNPIPTAKIKIRGSLVLIAERTDLLHSEISVRIIRFSTPLPLVIELRVPFSEFIEPSDRLVRSLRETVLGLGRQPLFAEPIEDLLGQGVPQRRLVELVLVDALYAGPFLAVLHH
jgi:hypothetical protein